MSNRIIGQKYKSFLKIENLLSKTCIFALWNNTIFLAYASKAVVNCLHLFCIFALWNNQQRCWPCRLAVVNYLHLSCIFALWNNRLTNTTPWTTCCELLAFILYLCSLKQPVTEAEPSVLELWIACIYLVSLLFETTWYENRPKQRHVVNCLHLSCIFALWNNLTIQIERCLICCELLAFILYLCSLKQPSNSQSYNLAPLWIACIYLVSLLFETTQWNYLITLQIVVNCLHLSCIFALWNNQQKERQWHTSCCELLAFILYLCSLKQPKTDYETSNKRLWIACIYLVSLLFETTHESRGDYKEPLWIACIYLVSLLFETTGS